MQLWSVHTVTVLLKENGSFSKWVGPKVDSVHRWLLHFFKTFEINTFIVNFGPVSETYAKDIYFKYKADQTSFD